MNGKSEEDRDRPPQNYVSSDHNHPNGVEIEKGVVIVEIEYIESKDLNNVTDVDAALKSLLTGLDSKDWVSVCDIVRRLSVFHKEEMLYMVEEVIPLVVKSLNNPRSALTQLLLKSSQDKRFVCEAAEKALIAMTTHVSPTLLLPKLEPCLKNRNPRIRAKASMCFSRLGIECIREYGIEKLVQAAATQLTDQLPESREAARTVLLELQTVYNISHHVEPEEEDHSDAATWEMFCQSNLSPLSAQAVLRVTNVAGVAREGLVTRS